MRSKGETATMAALGMCLVLAAAAHAQPPSRLVRGINPEAPYVGPADPAAFARQLAEAQRLGFSPKVSGHTQHDPDGPLYVAITFDDGPHEDVTPIVLDTLEEFEVTATFFAVGWRMFGRGKRALRQAALLAEVARRGYPVGNHTFKHHNLKEMPEARARADILKNEALMARILGYRPYLFRPPYGALTGRTRQWLVDRGYSEIRWNIDARDWRPAIAGTMSRRLMDDIRAKGGGIVLLHDTKPWTARVLPDFLAALQAENCARKARGAPLFIPVTVDFFIKDATGRPRAVPKSARDAETRYLRRLDRVCRSPR